MAGLALGTWIATLVVGAYMFSYTSQVGRPESSARSSLLPPSLLFAHPSLALVGLTVWIAYLYYPDPALAWVAFADVLVVAAIGDVLAVRTHKSRRIAREAMALASPEARADHTPAEAVIPVAAVVVHGVLAVTTIALILAVALRA